MEPSEIREVWFWPVTLSSLGRYLIHPTLKFEYMA
jgi:hypothetical protein